MSVWAPQILVPVVKNDDMSALFEGDDGGVRGTTYTLYPSIEIEMGVPLGTGNSVYTFPEVPTIGFVRGMTSSSIFVRDTSTEMGWILNDSCTRTR